MLNEKLCLLYPNRIFEMRISVEMNLNTLSEVDTKRAAQANLSER